MTLIWVVDAEPHLYSDNVSVEPCVAGPSAVGSRDTFDPDSFHDHKFQPRIQLDLIISQS